MLPGDRSLQTLPEDRSLQIDEAGFEEGNVLRNDELLGNQILAEVVVGLQRVTKEDVIRGPICKVIWVGRSQIWENPTPKDFQVFQIRLLAEQPEEQTFAAGAI